MSNTKQEELRKKIKDAYFHGNAFDKLLSILNQEVTSVLESLEEELILEGEVVVTQIEVLMAIQSIKEKYHESI